MALDPTAREANFRDSWKKHLVDNLPGVHISFDKSLATPQIQGRSVNRWLKVNIMYLHRETMSSGTLELRCCTRQDNEGFKLAQLTDTVMGVLSPDPNVEAENDGTKRIPFYRSMKAPTPWVLIGGIVIQDIMESGELEAPDETKYKVLTVISRFASKI